MGFDTLWRILSKDNALDASERLVLTVLEMHRNKETGACYPSRPTIAAETGMTVTGVHNVLIRLEKKSVLERRTAAGKPTHYEIHFHRIPVKQVDPLNVVDPLNPVDATRQRGGGDPSTSLTRIEKEQQKNIAEPVDEMWNVFKSTVLGTANYSLTSGRKRCLRLFHTEQLRAEAEPMTLFQAVANAIKADSFIMQNGHILPESVFRNQERRDRWATKARQQIPHRNGNGATNLQLEAAAL